LSQVSDPGTPQSLPSPKALFPAMTHQIEATIRMAGAQPSGISGLSWQLSRKANASPEGKFQLLNLYQMEREL